MAPTLSDYMDVIRRYLSGAILPEEFERVYLRMFKDDVRILPDEEYDALNGLFCDVDAYCGNAEIRSANDLDDAALRIRARSALLKLETISDRRIVAHPGT